MKSRGCVSSSFEPCGSTSKRGVSRRDKEGWAATFTKWSLVVGLSGCGGGQAAGPPPAPPPVSVAAPALALPSDLDVVVRLDLARMRAALPKAAASGLTQLAFDGALFGSTTDVVRAGLERAQQIWVAWRPGPRPENWDNVLVLRGDFSSIPEGELTRAFHPARPLPGGFRVYEARELGGRAAPARIYAHLDELWIVASEAEIDAVERVLEGRGSERGPEPPERGVVSFAARLPSLAHGLRRTAPKAARLLDQALEGRGSAQLASEGLDLTAEMQFHREEDARRAARALQILLAALALENSRWSKAIDVSTVAATLALRARVPHAVLSGAAWASSDPVGQP